MKRKIFHILLFAFFLMLASCDKSIMNEKPSSILVVPNSLADFQALLDNYDINVGQTPELGQLSSDDYEMDFTTWQNMYFARTRNSYIWAKDIYQGETEVQDWNQLYKQVFISNIVIEGLGKVDESADPNILATLLGSAYFFRAHAFYELAQHFVKPYDKSSSNSELGVPLSLSSKINIKPQKSTMQQTYDQIISDLGVAVKLVKGNVDITNSNRPNKPSVYGLLSRVFLSMREYSKAGLYADSCLKLYNNLLDYNTLSKTSTNPFGTISFNHPEIIFYSTTVRNVATSFPPSTPVVPNTLYEMYASSDLRKAIFFRVLGANQIAPKRSYAGTYGLFTGIAVDEMYLNRAECLARNGETKLAMDDLNALMVKRWDNKVPFSEFKAISSEDALNQILKERRKELVYRGLRWIDLRRLNKDGANITLKRNLNGQEYILPPNDPRYVLPIPPDEIALSGIEQNQR